MSRQDDIEVLVVGAGPVGMFTALWLSKFGIQTKIIDQDERPAAHSYACALHPRSLRLLHEIGIADEVLALGKRIETVGFYEGTSRRGEMDFSKLPGDFPFVITLPQGDFESLLEERLRSTRGIEVNWNHRLSHLQTEAGGIVATIEKLCESGKGYGVPDLDWEVAKTLTTKAAFVIGADSSNSFVRQTMAIAFEAASPPELFAIYEFESDTEIRHDLRITFDQNTCNVLWPLSDHRCRWSVQLENQELSRAFLTKERTDIVIVERAVDPTVLRQVKNLIQERAPWFEATVRELDWSVAVQFEPRLASEFGRDRCWLVGDAAHQTSPVGMQSMNLGLVEARELAGIIARILRDNGSLRALDMYHSDRHSEWQQLLGIGWNVEAQDRTDPWMKTHGAKIVPSVPASGPDLLILLRQIGLGLAANSHTKAAGDP